MKRKTCLLLMTLALALFVAFGALAAQKDEVIYARLSPAGTVEGVYVINAFEAQGAETVTDRGDYTETLPLGDAGGFAYADGQASFTMQPGRFSYQGTLADTALPWDIRLVYRLDGKEIEPLSLSGATGKLEIDLSVTVNEALRAYADSLSLQVTLTLDSERAFNIQAEKATYAVAGGNRTLAYVVLPGQNALYTLSADVRDFYMAGIQAAGVRMGMDEQMYQATAAKAMAGSPLEAAVSGLMGNFLRSMQGQATPSFTAAENAVRSVQFVLMGEGIPQKATVAEQVEEPQPTTFWERVLAVFGM